MKAMFPYTVLDSFPRAIKEIVRKREKTQTF